MKKLIFVFAVIGMLISSCRVQYVPIETGTTVHVIDSVAIHYLDSVRIHEATRYRDMAWLGDTLKIEGSRSRAWAYADTTKEALIGGLEEDKVEEKIRYIYKDRIEVRDSLVYKGVPVPVEIEKEVKIVPKFWRVTGVVGIISILVLLGFVGFKIWKLKGEGFLSVFKKLK